MLSSICMADFTPLKSTLKKFDPTQDRFISREFQKYAYDLAVALGDEKHMAIYMRLAKTTPRHLLENALTFVKDAKATNPGRLYMWKLKQLRAESKERADRRIPSSEKVLK
jgi:hypothetical protein